MYTLATAPPTPSNWSGTRQDFVNALNVNPELTPAQIPDLNSGGNIIGDTLESTVQTKISSMNPYSSMQELSPTGDSIYSFQLHGDNEPVQAPVDQTVFTPDMGVNPSPGGYQMEGGAGPYINDMSGSQPASDPYGALGSGPSTVGPTDFGAQPGGILSGGGNIAPGSTSSGDFGMDMAPSGGVAMPGNSVTAMSPEQMADPGASGGETGGLPGALGSILGGGGGGGQGIGQLTNAMGGGSTPSTDSFAALGSAGSPASDSGQGVPVQITDQASIGSQAGVNIEKGSEQVSGALKGSEADLKTGLASDTQSLDTTNKSIANLGVAAVDNPDVGWLNRAGVGVLAIVLIGTGIWLLKGSAKT